MAQQLPQHRLVKLTDELGFSVQPTEEEIKNLSKYGFKGVINMRFDWEKGFLKNEQELVESQGIKYAVRSIDTANDFTKDYTDALIQEIDNMPKPVLIHCNVGLTAAVASLVYAAKQTGGGSSDVFQWAKDLGYDFAFHARLYDFINSYFK